LAADAHVGRKVGRREEVLGKHAVGGRGRELRLGSLAEGGPGEVGGVEGGHRRKIAGARLNYNCCRNCNYEYAMNFSVPGSSDWHTGHNNFWMAVRAYGL
jgi:hypothetical protein